MRLCEEDNSWKSLQIGHTGANHAKTADTALMTGCDFTIPFRHGMFMRVCHMVARHGLGLRLHLCRAVMRRHSMRGQIEGLVSQGHLQ